MKKFTLKKFNEIEHGKVFASGNLPDNSEGINMMNTGKGLRWLAKKGGGDDWAIYSFWDHYSDEYILSYGQKVNSNDNIIKCIPCDDAVLNKYRH